MPQLTPFAAYVREHIKDDWLSKYSQTDKFRQLGKKWRERKSAPKSTAKKTPAKKTAAKKTAAKKTAAKTSKTPPRDADTGKFKKRGTKRPSRARKPAAKRPRAEQVPSNLQAPRPDGGLTGALGAGGGTRGGKPNFFQDD